MDFWSNLATSVVAGLAASGLTTWAALGLFRRQRMWERKLDAYTKAVKALHHLSNLLDVNLGETGVGAPEVEPGRKAELEARYRKANADLSRLIDMGELLLSRRAIRELQQMYGKIRITGRATMMASDHYAESLAAVLECQKKFLRIARSDLA